MVPHHTVWYYATVTVVCLFPRLSLCPEPVPKSKSERHSKLRIGKRDAHDMSDPWPILQRSKGQGARLWRHVVSFTSVLPISLQKKSQSTKIVKKIIRIADDIEHKFERQKVKRLSGRLTPWTKSAITSEREGLPTSHLMYGWSTMTHITDIRGDRRGQRSRL